MIILHRLIAIALSTGVLAAQGPMPDNGVTTTPVQKLRGRVTQGGSGVENATVHVAWRRLKVELGASARALETVVRTVRTNASGEYSVQVPAWRKVSAWASKGGAASSYRDAIETPSGTVDLALEAGITLRGRFVLEGRALDKQVAFVIDRLGKAKDSVPLQRSSVSDAQGRFSVSGLPSGTWQLRVKGDARGLRPSTIQLLDGDSEREIPLVVGARATLRFVRKDGSPDPRVAVEVIDHGVRVGGVADDRGQITLLGLQHGHGTDLIADPEVGPRRYFTLEPGAAASGDAQGPGVAPIEIRGHNHYQVEGKIFGIDSKPAAGVEVAFCGTIHGAGYPPADFSHIVKTDANGRYVCNQLDQNVVYEVFSVVAGEYQAIGTVDPRPQFFRAKLDSFRLGSRRVAVTVALPEAGGPHNPELRIYGPKESARQMEYVELVNNKSGQWISPTLLKGEYIVVAFSKQLGFSTAKHLVRATTTGRASESLKMRLLPARKLEGTIVDAARKPMRGIKVAVVFEGGNFENAPQNYQQSVAAELLSKHWPEDKFPRKLSTTADGKFSIMCFEAAGLYDLIASQKTGGDAAQGSGPPPTRMTRVLALPNPITLTIR